MGGFWKTSESKLLIDFQEELTVKELEIIIKTRSRHGIAKKIIALDLKAENRTCRYCLKYFTPKRRDQIFCCKNCCQLKARLRHKLKKEEQ